VFGAAYVFAADGDGWGLAGRLTPDTDNRLQQFGASVAVSADGSRVLVGAPWEDRDDDRVWDQFGAAYLFTRADDWSQRAELAPHESEGSDLFGDDVALSADGETALVGAPGTEVDDEDATGLAYVFELTDGFGSGQQAKLAAEDGDGDDWFGSSVALSADGTTALVSAPGDEDPNGESAGSASVFATEEGWRTDAGQRAKLVAEDGDDGDRFGDDVSLSGDGTTALVGAPEDADPNGESAGSAYVFAASSGDWAQRAKLVADDGDPEDWFGGTVALSADGTAALVGASNDEDPNGSDAGAAYRFATSGDGWTQRSKLAADDGDPEDGFGRSVALSADGAVTLVGAPGAGENAGAAYLYE
jgi:hypothetical protein